MYDHPNNIREGEATAEPALSAPNSASTFIRVREGEATVEDPERSRRTESALSAPTSASKFIRTREGEATVEDPERSRGAEPALSRPDSSNRIVRIREGEATVEDPERSRGAEPALSRPKNWHDPRKRPAHGVTPTPGHMTVVFVTVCTKNRDQWLAEPVIHDLLLDVWRNAQGWLVGRYVIMPDHIHLFAGWNGGKWSLETWCQFWKARFSVAHKTPLHQWQTGHWDTRMASYDQFVAKWEYVKENPVRHRLVNVSTEWPYQGILCEFGAW